MASVGGGGGGSQPAGNTVTNSSSAPWESQQPYLEKGFEEAQNLYESATPEYYADSTVAPMNQLTDQALQLQAARAQGGNPLLNQAQDVASSTLSGDFMSPNSNPFFQSALDAASQGITRNYNRAVAPGIASSFEKAGRYGSPAFTDQNTIAQENLVQGLGNIGAQMSSNLYNTERQNQLNTMNSADALGQADYNDIAQLARAGQGFQGQTDAELSADINRFNFEQEKPQYKLQNFLTATQGGQFGGTKATSQPYFNNTGANVLGGALGGASLGGQFGGGTGAMFGAALGGLGGLL